MRKLFQTLILISALLFFNSLAIAQNKLQQRIQQLSGLTPTCNLVVEIKNVADKYVEHKSFTNLLVDDELFQPLTPTLGKNEIAYYLNVPLGVHRVKAVYYLINGWNNKRYEINTQRPIVNITRNQRIMLSIKLNKKRNGQLKRSKNYFIQTIESIFGSNQKQNRFAGKQKRFLADVQRANNSIGGSLRQKSPAMPQKILLQINTLPVNAEIIIDDKHLGHAPIIVSIERNKDHVVQIYAAGYRGKMKLIQKEKLLRKEKYILMEELEKGK